MPRTDSFTPPYKKTLRFLSLCFLAMILFSVIGLDYISWKKGNKSYIFNFLAAPSIQDNIEALDEIVLRSLASLGLQPDPSRSTKDEAGGIKIPVWLDRAEYKKRASALEAELGKAQIHVEIEETTDNNSDIYLWKLEGMEKQRASLVFMCPIGMAAPAEDPDIFFPKNKVALIVDDMGYSLETLEDLGHLGLSLTIAILPYSPWARETAQIAHQNNMEVILHLPLESLNDHESNIRTRGLIHSKMTEKDILETLETDLAKIPFIRGVNNHMGSKITSERDIMSLILKRLKKNNLYFIDSVTTGSSIAFELARDLSVSTAFRDVFLDSETDEDYIQKQLIQLLRLAQNKGVAVGICHPYDSTLKVLSENLGLFEEYNCETVFASQIVK